MNSLRTNREHRRQRNRISEPSSASRQPRASGTKRPPVRRMGSCSPDCHLAVSTGIVATARQPTCPWCSAPVDVNRLEFRTPFPCPWCGVTVQVQPIWMTTGAATSFTVGFGLAYALGVSTANFFVTVVADFVYGFLALRFVPPRLEMGDGRLNLR